MIAPTYGPLFIHMHQYRNKPYYLLRLTMTGSRNSRWRSSKPEVPLFQFVEKLTTRLFQIMIPCFRDQQFTGATPNTATPHRKSEFKMELSKPEVPIFQLVEELATRFQIIIPRFRGRAIQWRYSMLICVQVEIWVLPDWRPPSWICHFRLGCKV